MRCDGELVDPEVKLNSLLSKIVREGTASREICSSSVDKNGLGLEFVQNQIFDYDTYIKNVQKDGLALKDVPLEMLNWIMCCIAVEQNGLALEHVDVQAMFPALDSYICSSLSPENCLPYPSMHGPMEDYYILCSQAIY